MRASVIAPRTCSRARSGTINSDERSSERSSSRCVAVARPRDDLLVADLGEQLRLAGADHVGDPAGLARVRRVALAHPPGELDLGRVDVRDRDVAQVAFRAGHVDRAPVGEVAHPQLRDGGQGAPHVQRRVERRADVGEEAHPLQGGALGVDEPRDADDRRAPPSATRRQRASYQCALPSGQTRRAGRAGAAIGRRGGHRRAQGGAVLGVHTLQEGLQGGGGAFAGRAGEGGQRPRPAHRAGGHVEVEEHGARGIEHERQLIAAQAMRASRVVLVRSSPSRASRGYLATRFRGSSTQRGAFATNSDCAASPSRPRSSLRIECASPAPWGSRRVRASSSDPFPGRLAMQVDGEVGVDEQVARRSRRTREMPLPKSAAATARARALGGSSSISGRARRNHARAGPLPKPRVADEADVHRRQVKALDVARPWRGTGRTRPRLGAARRRLVVAGERRQLDLPAAQAHGARADHHLAARR